MEGRQEVVVLTAGKNPAMGEAMTTEAILTLQRLIDYCHEQWEEADRPVPSGWPTPDMQTGKKMAYNDVLQFARQLLANAKG